MHTKFWLEDLVDSKSLEKLSFEDGMILKDMLLGTSCEDVNQFELMHGKVQWRRRMLRLVPRMYHAAGQFWKKNRRLREM